ncbi:hypothetical protein SKAU_G00140910 [Synaphobranchus kaupii]|uniref:Uncharacterized protein n=1 Tax=Synaphobranchus kaupii TaxID=118154 RepID=A0A9Q1FS86_SYNKA|nr:hypothetical protein SKAU_G00140910 [Synaphobranchus kaupii]
MTGLQLADREGEREGSFADAQPVAVAGQALEWRALTVEDGFVPAPPAVLVKSAHIRLAAPPAFIHSSLKLNRIPQ